MSKRKLFTVITVIFIIIAFSRTVFGASDISTHDILSRLSVVSFDFEDLSLWYSSVVDYVSEDNFLPSFSDDMDGWDKILTALDAWFAKPMTIILGLVRNLFVLLRDAAINVVIIFGVFADILGITNVFAS